MPNTVNNCMILHYAVLRRSILPKAVSRTCRRRLGAARGSLPSLAKAAGLAPPPRGARAWRLAAPR
eukprot:3353048-Alexandrium_andersonii.AAC.1